MKILLKIILFPIILTLTILSLVCRLANIIGGTIIGSITSIFFVFTVICIAMGFAPWDEAKWILLLCVLFSDIGLFGLFNLMLNGVDAVTRKLRQVTI